MAAQVNLDSARDIAIEQFAAKEPKSMAKNALVVFNEQENFFEVPYLGGTYRVFYPSGEVTRADMSIDVPLVVRIILLHYLTQAGPGALTGTRIAYQSLPSGFIYVEPFTNRAIRPLVKIFGNHPDKLKEVAQQLGGKTIKMGDLAVEIPVLPKVPITFVLWLGDDEFPASGNVLFDGAAGSHLHTEDYALIPGMVLWEMKRMAGL